MDIDLIFLLSVIRDPNQPEKEKRIAMMKLKWLGYPVELINQDGNL